MSPPRNSRSPKFISRSKISSPHTSPSTPSPSSSRHRHSQSLQSLQSIRTFQSIPSHTSTSSRKPPRPLLERLLSPLALSPMSSPLHSPLPTLSFESQQLLLPSPHKESRSERLLREALIKDDLALSQTPTPMAAQEPTLLLLGLPSPPLTRPAHRRRHSAAPVASKTAVVDVLTKAGYGYAHGAEGNGNGNAERRSDQKRGARASELRDRGHDGEPHQQAYEQPLSSSPSSSSLASSLYPHSQHSHTTRHTHSHSLSTPQSPKLYYGGDAETMYPSPAPSFPPYSAFPRRTEPTLPSSEVRPHRGYSTPDVRRNVSTDPRRVDSSPNPRRGDPPRADSPSPRPRYTPCQASASTSTSPSPYSRQRQAPNSPIPRPRSPALYQSTTRPHSPSPSPLHPQTPTPNQSQRSQKRQSLPANIHSALPAAPFASNQAQAVHAPRTTPGIPLPMTPHEKALRARLERVLYGNGGAPEGGKIRKEGEARPERRERCGSNEVRDETGGWPWRERERDMISTPPTSASSSGSGSHSPNSPLSQPSQLSQEQQANNNITNNNNNVNNNSLSSSSASIAKSRPQRQTSPSVTRDASPSVHRARGSSESQSQSQHQTPNGATTTPNGTPNRNRSTTSPFQSRIPQPAVYRSQPVTPRTPARGTLQQQQRDAARSQSRTPRSPMPQPMPVHLPSTPRRATTVGTTTPRTPRTPALAPAAPPRTPKIGATPTPRTPRAEVKGAETETGSEAESKVSQSEAESRESGGVLTPPPTPPVRARVPESSPAPFRLQTGVGMGRPNGRGRSTSAEGSEEEEGSVDDVGAGTGTDTDADAGAESDATGEHHGGERIPTMMKPRRPFNARKASERLRGTEGYVSFASVEGLGEPPDTPVCETEGEVRGRRGFGLGVLAGWWGSRAGGEVA